MGTIPPAPWVCENLEGLGLKHTHKPVAATAGEQRAEVRAGRDSAIHEEEQVCERSAPLGLGVWGKDLEKTLPADFDLKCFSLVDWREPICMEQKADHHPLCEGDCWLRIILIW